MQVPSPFVDGLRQRGSRTIARSQALRARSRSLILDREVLVDGAHEARSRRSGCLPTRRRIHGGSGAEREPLGHGAYRDHVFHVVTVAVPGAWSYTVYIRTPGGDLAKLIQPDSEGRLSTREEATNFAISVACVWVDAQANAGPYDWR